MKTSPISKAEIYALWRSLSHEPCAVRKVVAAVHETRPRWTEARVRQIIKEQSRKEAATVLTKALANKYYWRHKVLKKRLP